MKKLFVLALLAFFATGVFSQITSSNVPAIGDTAVYQYADTTGFDPGMAGSGVTWDFSTVNDSAGEFVFRYLDPANTPYGSTFSDPGTIAATDGSRYTFWKADADSLYIVGESNQFTLNAPAEYTDPIRVFEFPFAMSGVVTDASIYSQYTASGFDVYRTGTYTTTYDGMGTLTLPNDSTFGNAVRIKKEIFYRDSSFALGFTVINTYDVISYEWYDFDSSNAPMMIYWEQEVSLAGNVSNDAWVYYRQFPEDTTMTSIRPERNVLQDVQVFPNPASDQAALRFDLAASGNVLVEVYNLMGQKVAVVQNGALSAGTHSLAIPVAGFEPGAYLVRMESENGVLTRKLVVAE